MDFALGDQVMFTNDNGVTFGPKTITGFREPDPDFLPDRTIYIDSDSPWFPVKPEQLRKVGSPEETKKPKRRRKNCLALELIGVDYWCRPVYKDDNGKLWKDVNLGCGTPSLYGASDNDFDGEPDWPIRVKYQII
jgi:hypothetical protein